jgi:hypothetical protein
MARAISASVTGCVLQALDLIIKGASTFFGVRSGRTVMCRSYRKGSMVACSRHGADGQLAFDQGTVQAAGLVRDAAAAKHIQAGWTAQQAVEHRKGEEIGVLAAGA